MGTKSNAQQDVTILLNANEDYAAQLKEFFIENDTIEHLSIVIPDNSGGYDIYGKVDHQTDYSNPIIHYKPKISTLPEELCKLVHLKTLNISNLGLKSLPECLTNFDNLELLNISRNELNLKNELIKISRLKSLQTLKLYGCALSTEVIKELKKLKLKNGFFYTLEDAEKESKADFVKYRNPDDRDSIIFNLLKEVHKFYPIGRPYSNDQYPGYSELEAITSNKINKLINNEKIEIWDSFIKDFSLQVRGNKVINLVSKQFPSYELMLHISDTSTEQIRTRKSMTIVLSLLTHHYSVYFESLLFLHDYKVRGRPLSQLIIYGEENATLEEKEIQKRTKALMVHHFPSYEFVNHSILFQTKVSGGLPYGENKDDIKQEYPIYNFLFGLSDGMKKEIIE